MIVQGAVKLPVGGHCGLRRMGGSISSWRMCSVYKGYCFKLCSDQVSLGRDLVPDICVKVVQLLYRVSKYRTLT